MIQRLVQLPKPIRADRIDHIEHTVETERWPDLWAAFVGELPGQRSVSEAQAVLFLEKPSIGSAYCNVFGMTDAEIWIEASVQEPAASQREAAIADICIVVELRPVRSDIIELEEFRPPLRGVAYESVPLDDEDMIRFDVLAESGENEIRIVRGRP